MIASVSGWSDAFVIVSLAICYTIHTHWGPPAGTPFNYVTVTYEPNAGAEVVADYDIDGL